MSNLQELKEKAEELKKRNDDVLQVLTKAEAQKEMLHKRLKEEFGITPDQIDDTLKTMEETINNKKQNIESALINFEQKLSEVEKIINE